VWLDGVEIWAADSGVTWSYDLALVEGDNLFSLTSQDLLGNESDATTGSIFLDTVFPVDPTVTSADPAAGVPTTDILVDLTWNPGTDEGTGVAGYSWLMDQSPVTTPPETVTGESLPLTVAIGPAEGDWYIHVSTVDGAGNWTSTYHYGPWVLDLTGPDAPVITTDGGNGPGVDFGTANPDAVLAGTVGADAAQVLVNGSDEGVTYTAGETAWTWTGSLEPGANRISVAAVDAAENQGPEAGITVTFRLEPGDFYVNPAQGTDGPAFGLSPDAGAFASLHFAVDLVNAGEPGAYTLHAAAGDYRVEPLGSEADAPLVITMNDVALVGAGQAVTLLSGADAVSWLTAVTVAADGVSVRGLATDRFDLGIEVRDNFLFVLITDNALAGYEACVDFGASDGSILRNRILAPADGEGLVGIRARNGSPMIENNLVVGLSTGLLLSMSGSPVFFNTIVENGLGVDADQGPGVILTGNIIAFNQSGAVLAMGATESENDFFGNVEFDLAGLPDSLGGTLYEDPLFVNRAAGDFRIQGVSPCVDATTRADPGMDLDGLARPQHTAWDMGALEKEAFDTDGDGLVDYVETGTGVYVSERDTGTAPNNPDTDGDGLGDGVEPGAFGTDPNRADTDGDTVDDGQEILDGTSPLDPYSFILPAGAPPRFETPMPTEAQKRGMGGREYAHEVVAQAGGGSHEGLTYSLVNPPGGAVMDTVTDGLGRDVGRLSFLPPGAGEYALDIRVTDGTSQAAYGVYTVTVAEALRIDPVSAALLRTTGDLGATEVARGFTITGGTPDPDPVSNRYDVELLAPGAAPELGGADPVDGVFTYTLDTTDRPDGEYRLRVTDAWGFVTVSGPVFIHTATLAVLGESVTGDGSGGASLVVGGGGGAYSGTTITVPPGTVPAGELFLSASTAGGSTPWLAAIQRRGEILYFNAVDALGNAVEFAGPVAVTIPYGGLLEPGDDPADLVIVHYNEAQGRWERVAGVVVNEVDQTLTFFTDGFSLFSPVLPVALETEAIGGSQVQNYRMLSFAGMTFDQDVRAALAGILGAYDDTMWRLFAHDALSGMYVEATEENAALFGEEYALKPGASWWFISRNDAFLSLEGLAYQSGAGAQFYTVLPPGWSMLAHPWETTVSLLTHDLEVSEDGETWMSVTSEGNDLTGPSLWLFKGPAGEAGAWYDEALWEDAVLPAYTAGWVKNLTGRPVFLRMVDKDLLGKANGLPGRLRKAAGDMLAAGMKAAVADAWAASLASGTPPDPPGSSGSGAGAIGVDVGEASGGGFCFVRSAAGPSRPGGGLLFLVLAGIWAVVWLARGRRGIRPPG
ncbi:MAG: DUF5123 domain-containing protein, partial [Proteobacteria bacterium]|nr:DUF5123 domain-containing protein [Pseudomonadota bacterium]